MYDKVDNKGIGERLRNEREKLGLTREKFAEIVELSPLYIGQLERGERQMSLNTLLKISKCLNISLDYLVTGRHNNKLNFVIKDNEKFDYLENNISNKEIIKNLLSLFNRCSQKQLLIIQDLIKVILPHI